MDLMDLMDFCGRRCTEVGKCVQDNRLFKKVRLL